MSVPILMYHKVAPLKTGSTLPGHYLEPSRFAGHMRLLRALRYEVIPLDEVLLRSSAKRRIAITFDDGYENFSSQALPILYSFSFTSTVFLVANQLGGSNTWDASYGEPHELLMSKDQIRDAMNLGTSFGSHTSDHLNLQEVSLEVAKAQIFDSKARLEEELQVPIDTFCYPYGKKNREVASLVSRAGYRLACGTEKGVNTEFTDPMALKRINVRRETSNPVLMYKLWRGMNFGK